MSFPCPDSVATSTRILSVPLIGYHWQESYQTGDPNVKFRAAHLRKCNFRVKSFGMGRQVTDCGSIKVTIIDIHAQ